MKTIFITFLFFTALLPANTGRADFLPVTPVYPVQKSIMETDTMVFRGILMKVKYSNNRKIKDAPFEINNTTASTVKIQLVNATLLRGLYEDALKDPHFYVFLNGKKQKCKTFNLKAHTKIQLNIVFGGYTIYAGSNYAVKAYITMDNKAYEAVSPLEIYRLEIKDKNRYKPDP